ncbi:MAG TPA: DUF1161 domain-containing protein [Gallionellaceae bacterium]|nr:DUF1161 domain-containing protein [Gallionellaceae bacterium]
MRKVVLLSCLTLVSHAAMAEVLSCDALKARVDAKLQAKDVPSYTLEIVPAEGLSNPADAASAVPAVKMNKGKEVGTCNGGTKRLIYTKGN